MKRFLVAGVGAVGTDLGTYYIMLNFFTHGVAKAISFMLGTAVAYFINKYWTFEKHDRSVGEVLKFALLYTCTLGANVVINKLVLNNTGLTLLAFIVATCVSTVLNFIGQKFWVFK